MPLPDEILAAIFARLAYTPAEPAVRLSGRLGRAAVNSAPAPDGWHAARAVPRLESCAQGAFLLGRPARRPEQRATMWTAAVTKAIRAEDEAALWDIIETTADVVATFGDCPQLRLAKWRSPWFTGSVRVARWVYGTLGPWVSKPGDELYANSATHSDFVRRAARSGPLELVQWLADLEDPVDYCRWTLGSTVLSAATYGNFHIAEWVVKHYRLSITELGTGNEWSIAHDACAEGELAAAQWIVSVFGPLRNYPDDNNDFDEGLALEAFMWACRRGHADVARWMIAEDPQLAADAQGRATYIVHMYAEGVRAGNADTAELALELLGASLAAADDPMMACLLIDACSLGDLAGAGAVLARRPSLRGGGGRELIRGFIPHCFAAAAVVAYHGGRRRYTAPWANMRSDRYDYFGQNHNVQIETTDFTPVAAWLVATFAA